MTPPSAPALLPAKHNAEVYRRAGFARAQPDCFDALLHRYHNQSISIDSATDSIRSAAPSQLRDEEFISRYSELKFKLEAKNLSGAELSSQEKMVLKKIQDRFRQYYSKTEKVDPLLTALAEHGRLFLDS